MLLTHSACYGIYGGNTQAIDQHWTGMRCRGTGDHELRDLRALRIRKAEGLEEEWIFLESLFLSSDNYTMTS